MLLSLPYDAIDDADTRRFAAAAMMMITLALRDAIFARCYASADAIAYRRPIIFA